ncbi:hypothetical protein [Catellatospora sp. NPDC049609]|uniref:hypothetical protein n=1 Tax=Catellatospora sp. NPDC049609 TaxID=3155505 RepID=UPI003431207E
MILKPPEHRLGTGSADGPATCEVSRRFLRRTGAGAVAAVVTAATLITATAPAAAASTPRCNYAAAGRNAASTGPRVVQQHRVMRDAGRRDRCRVKQLQGGLNICYGQRLTGDGVYGPGRTTPRALRSAPSV